MAQPAPPSVDRTYGLDEDDPFLPLNYAFLDAYSRLRAETVAATGPVILQMGDVMYLLHNGAQLEAATREPIWHELKVVAHVPLAVYAILLPAAGADLDETRADELRRYRELARRARDSLEGRAFSEAQLVRQQRLLETTLEFIDHTLETGEVSADGLRAFARDRAADCMANVYEAAAHQIDVTHRQVQIWLASMTPDERRDLRVVVVGRHMPRTGNLALQYFSMLQGEPYEGRYEHEELESTRLVYAESLANKEQALVLLGEHMVAAAAGEAFFGDAASMHRDIQADAGERIIQREFGIELRSDR